LQMQKLILKVMQTGCRNPDSTRMMPKRGVH
jgi:hypothetical protein